MLDFGLNRLHLKLRTEFIGVRKKLDPLLVETDRPFLRLNRLNSLWAESR
jgi:hypothetical protein